MAASSADGAAPVSAEVRREQAAHEIVESHATALVRAHLERMARGSRRSDLVLLRPTWFVEESLLLCASPEPAFFAHCRSQAVAEGTSAHVYWTGVASPCLDNSFSLRSLPAAAGRPDHAKAWVGRSELEMPLVLLRFESSLTKDRRAAVVRRCLAFTAPDRPRTGGLADLDGEDFDGLLS